VVVIKEERESIKETMHPYSRKKTKHKEEREHLISYKTNAAKKRYSKTHAKYKDTMTPS